MNKLYESVWDALEGSPRERANLRLRSDLMIKIASEIRSDGWTRAEATVKCAVNQPRINDLLRGRIARFSLDALVNIASAMGHGVQILVEA